VGLELLPDEQAVPNAPRTTIRRIDTMAKLFIESPLPMKTPNYLTIITKIVEVNRKK